MQLIKKKGAIMDGSNGLSQDFALGMNEALAQEQAEHETRQSAYDEATRSW